MVIRTVIAEDEAHSRERLKKMLLTFPDLDIVGEAANGAEAVELIERLKPDLVFLDIRMPEVTGVEVLDKISFMPKIIFVTAYDQYAIKAFEENAVDYILKPYSSERIERAVQRVLDLNQKVEISARLIENLRHAMVRKEYMRRFAVRMGDEILIIPEQDVCYFKAENKYIMLYTAQKKYFIETTLKELEQNLNPETFIRIHKGVIVALSKIKKIRKWFHSDFYVQVSDAEKTKLKVSRSYQAALKEKLKF